MKNIKTLALAAFVFSLVFTSHSEAARKALIYLGPGSCPERCSTEAAKIARAAGFQTRFVRPHEINPAIFNDAAIWIQPGGVAVTAMQAMKPQLHDNIRRFVANGGGYVGFCAGGFLATPMIGTSRYAGLGLIPGRSSLRTGDQSAAILPIIWNGVPRSIYYEGGPFFTFMAGAAVEPIASYSDGTISALRAFSGRGRVYVTGLHPEAPQQWRDHFKLADDDGIDHDLAREMMEWAAGLR